MIALHRFAILKNNSNKVIAVLIKLFLNAELNKLSGKYFGGEILKK